MCVYYVKFVNTIGPTLFLSLYLSFSPLSLSYNLFFFLSFNFLFIFYYILSHDMRITSCVSFNRRTRFWAGNFLFDVFEITRFKLDLFLSKYAYFFINRLIFQYNSTKFYIKSHSNEWDFPSLHRLDLFDLQLIFSNKLTTP